MHKPMLFLDPGDVHVGHAVFEQAEHGWHCTDTFESSPEVAEAMLHDVIREDQFSVIGYERFRLFGHLALAQTGSEFRASQLIGVLKFLHRTYSPECKLVVQDPNVQPIAWGLANKRGIPLHSVVHANGPHAKSAELHGLYFLARSQRPLSVVGGKLSE